MRRAVPEFRAATPENPSFDLNSPDAWDALGAQRASTGLPVSPESALNWSAWWRGVSLLAKDCAKTPLHLYRRLMGKNEGREKAVDHPSFRLLRWKASELMTAFQFRMAMSGHAINRGNGYSYIWREGPNPVELLILDPDQTYPHHVNNRLWYVTEINGEKRKLPADDVLHLAGFGFDGLQGYPAFTMARDTIALGLADNIFKGVRYRNSARPNVILETPNKVNQTTRQELRQEWERMHQGLQNAHRTAILDNGLKANKLAFTAEEMQEVEQAGLTIRAAAAFLGVPPHKMGDTSRTAYSSIEQENQSYLDDGLDFWFCVWEFAAWDKLLLESEKESDLYTVEFHRQSLIRADMKSRSQYYNTALAGRGWMTPNEVRDMEGMDPDEADESDQILTPLNMGQGGADNDPSPGPQKLPKKKPPVPVAPDDPKDDKRDAATEQMEIAARAMLKDATCRMVRRIAIHAQRAAKDPAKYSEFSELFQTEHSKVFCEAFRPGELAAMALGSVISEGCAADYTLSLLRSEFKQLVGTSADQLPMAVDGLIKDQESRIAHNVISNVLSRL